MIRGRVKMADEEQVILAFVSKSSMINTLKAGINIKLSSSGKILWHGPYDRLRILQMRWIIF